uniref:Condensin2 complex subunit H2 putative n=1 Tax=Albugo laibachii Nc14 TaxID=890382 RepID=F0WCS6_9STRA|nr:condensin2 complex subunit H2 putative [Albugo laibachii Nc14]|eukprot:CCA18995.1 condensin2 complex subunit H2 putative [Albugo laibachii Nc14]
MSQNSARFQHLLQPIRCVFAPSFRTVPSPDTLLCPFLTSDLSQNWNIDLAQELEEYLEELEHLKIGFDKESEISVAKNDDSKISFLNFAEAALVIQNTSAIYSRKVEYLYALVFQVLEYISRPQSSNAPTDPQTTGKPLLVNDTFTDPLPIIETLVECKQISRKQVSSDEPLEDEMLKSTETWINQPKEELRVSIRFAKMASKRHESIENSVALMNSFLHVDWENGKDAFKMLSCALHPSGVLLFDETSRKYLGNDVLSREIHAEMTNFLQESAETMEIPQDVSFEAECDPIDPVDAVEENVENVESGEIVDQRPMEKDLWTLLDPYDATNAIVCPFEKGKTFVQPRKKKRKRDDTSEPELPSNFGQQTPLQDSWSWRQDKEALMRKLTPKMGSTPLLGKKNETLWKMENAWKRWVHRRRLVDETSASAALLLAQEGNENAIQDEIQDAVDLQPEMEMQEQAPDDIDWNADAPTSESIETPSAPISSYEELCRQHISDFMKGTEEYLHESNLTKKITFWKAKLTPCLKEQATHSAFDIQTYGSQILTQLNDPIIPSSVPFDQLVTGFPPYQVCRTFLASLQLANNGNVALFHDSPRTLELQLKE